MGSGRLWVFEFLEFWITWFLYGLILSSSDLLVWIFLTENTSS